MSKEERNLEERLKQMEAETAEAVKASAGSCNATADDINKAADAGAENVATDSAETKNADGAEQATESTDADAARSCGANEAENNSNKESHQADAQTDSEQKAQEDSEKYLRLLAEFQNFKKRSAKEKSDIHAYANEKIINDLLPVLDNFERALGTAAGDDPEAYAKGMALIFEQMKTALEKAGLKEVEALGETFDPTKHNAVMMEDSKDYESGKVSQVLQKGYALNDRVLRAAMVAVSK